jgi:hypothetical protein
LQEQTFGALQNQYFPAGHRSLGSPGQAASLTIGVAFRISACSLDAPVWGCASAEKAPMPSKNAPALNAIANFRIGDTLVWNERESKDELYWRRDNGARRRLDHSNRLARRARLNEDDLKREQPRGRLMR